MIDYAGVAKQAIAHMRNGEVQIADDILTSALRAHAAEKAAASGAKPEPPPPRATNAVLLDVLSEILGLFGVPPKLEALIKELEAVL